MSASPCHAVRVQKTVTALDLTHGLECVPEKSRKIEEGTDSQTRDGDQRHGFLLRLQRAPLRKAAPFEQDFCGPGSQVGRECHAMAGVGAENDCVAGRVAIL